MSATPTTSPAPNEPNPSPAWVERYLALLGTPPEPPSVAALSRMIRAHHQQIVFENITSILRRASCPDAPVPPMDPDETLRMWEEGRGGGVCYELATMFERLLRGLGYDTSLALAQISIPGGHLAVVVHLDGQQYLVDMGCGAPIFEPIPLGKEARYEAAGLAYRFRAGDTPHEWVQDRWIDETWQPYCRYDLRPSTAADRNGPYQHHHTPNASWVTGELRIMRCDDDTVHRLTESEYLQVSSTGKISVPVEDPEHFARLASDIFAMDRMPFAEAHRARTWILSLAEPVSPS